MEQPAISTVELALQDGTRFRARDAAGADAVMDALPPFGQHTGLTPMEMLLAGLGGCTALDVISILRKKRQEVTDYRLEVQGVKASEHPKVYTEITVHHIVSGHNVSEEAVRHAIELSEEKYCSAYAMLSKATEIRTTFEVRRAGAMAAAG